MAYENATVISGLTPANPTPTDPKSQGDDHIRMLKRMLQNQFPDGAGGSGFKIPLTATTQELNWVAGVTSDIQTQLDKLGNDIGDSGLDGRVTANEQNIASNLGKINTNTGNISSNLGKIDTNIGNISSNSSAIFTLQSEMLNLQGRVNNLEIMRIVVTGTIDGATGTLTSQWGDATIKSVVRTDVGIYVVTFDVARDPKYIVTAACNGVIAVHRDSVTQFTLESYVAGGVHYDTPELMFLVVH